MTLQFKRIIKKNFFFTYCSLISEDCTLEEENANHHWSESFDPLDNVHSDTEEKLYFQQDCNDILLDKSDSKKVKRIHKESSKDNKCNICHEIFSSLKVLKSHMSEIHKEQVEKVQEPG